MYYSNIFMKLRTTKCSMHPYYCDEFSYATNIIVRLSDRDKNTVHHFIRTSKALGPRRLKRRNIWVILRG